MSLSRLVANGSIIEDVDPGYISDAAMEQLCMSVAMETLNVDEMEQYLLEAETIAVTEAQKNIVRLNKQAKLNQAYKTAVLQCAAEDKRKEYKKLRTLWKLEAKLFRKLEQQYKNKAMARARVAVKEQKKRKSNMANIAGARANQKMSGATSLLQSGPVKIKK